MSSLTVTPDALRGQVRLDVDLSDVAATAVVLARTVMATGVTTYLRGAGSVASSGITLPSGAIGNNAPTTLLGRLVAYDTEAPLDTLLQYSAAFNSGTTKVALNLNPYFENGRLSPWSVSAGGAQAVSTTRSHQGTYSYQFTPDGVTANPSFLSEEVAAVPGQSYTVAGQLWPTATFTWSVGISWYDNTHTLLSTSAFAVSATGGAWLAYSNGATAPANTAFARIRVQATGTPAGSNILFADELVISTPVNVSLVSAVTQVQGNGYGWLRDPLRPANNVRLDMSRRSLGPYRGQGVAWLGHGDMVDAANSSAFNINNSAYPAYVVRSREASTGQFKLFGRSAADITALSTLFTAGGALLLQLPGDYQESDRYLMPANVTRSYVFNDQRKGGRLLSIPFASVLAPVGVPSGTLGERWTDLCNRQATWGALFAAQGGAYDSFARTVTAGSWGAPDVVATPGSSWTVAGTAGDFSVNGTVGLIALSVVNTQDRATIGSAADSEQYLRATVPVVATGAPYQVAVLARNPDASNHYRLGIQFGLAGATTIFVIKRVAGVETTVASVAGPTYAAGQMWRIHASVVGTALKVSGWKDGTPEPVEFSVSTSDGALASAGPYGVFALLTTGNTNTLPVSVQVDDYSVKGAVTWQGILDGAVA